MKKTLNKDKTKKLNKFCFHKLFPSFSELLHSINFYLRVLRVQFGQFGRRAGVQTPWTPPLDACLNLLYFLYKQIKNLAEESFFQVCTFRFVLMHINFFQIFYERFTLVWIFSIHVNFIIIKMIVL